MGWILVMFDLPVMTDQQRRTATRFRKDLLDDGYLMIQYSIYARPCVNWEKMQKHTSWLEKLVPPGGNVRVLFITDKQWEHALTVIGEDYQQTRTQKDPEMPKQLEFW